MWRRVLVSVELVPASVENGPVSVEVVPVNVEDGPVNVEVGTVNVEVVPVRVEVVPVSLEEGPAGSLSENCRVNTRFTPTITRKPFVGANLVFARPGRFLIFCYSRTGSWLI